jgi:Fur family transcriptional regulator, peroxide stress response regulator
MKDAKRLLEEKGISPSLQRVIILRYLMTHHYHPSTEEVYQALLEEIPTLSKTTIYNTMKLFAQKGIIRQIAIYGNEVHYETQLDFHAHFHCLQCGRIFDLEIDEQGEFPLEREGHEIIEKEVVFRGTCRHCRRA